MSEGEADLRAILEMLDPPARDTFRRIVIRDQADRDAIASHPAPLPRLARRRLGDFIGMLTMYPGARRRVIRVLGEIDAR